MIPPSSASAAQARFPGDIDDEMTGIFSLKPVLLFEVESVVVDLHAFSNAVKNGLAVCEEIVLVVIASDRRDADELDIDSTAAPLRLKIRAFCMRLTRAFGESAR